MAGFLSAFEQPNALLVYTILAICVLSYLFVTANMIELLRLKFYPTYAAFTFPYVISAIAFKSANAFLVKNGFGFFSFAPTISEWIAVIVVAYVLARYAAFVVSTPTLESR
jgi:exfoliative toxin A/B